MTNVTYFCVDIECSGPVPGIYDMISLGAVPVTVDGTSAKVEDDLFYVEICPTGPKVDPGAMAVNGLDLEDLRANGLPLASALQKLSDWVASKVVNGTTPVFVGHNAPFDWSFVSHGYVSCEMKNPFGYKALDTKALAMGVLKVPWLDSNKELLVERLTLPRVESDRIHRADYDAWFQAHILARLLEHAGVLS